MTDLIRVLLAEKVAARGAKSIAQEMGYSPRMIENACTRINAITIDMRLGIGSAGYDFKYSSRDFLLRLAQVLEVDSKSLQQAIRTIEQHSIEERRAFPAWIFVETGFNRCNEPTFALAVMENHRRITLPLEICMLTRTELLEKSREIVRQHHVSTSGYLPLWGAIQHYKLILSETEQAVLDTNGHLVKVEPLCLSSAARVAIR